MPKEKKQDDEKVAALKNAFEFFNETTLRLEKSYNLLDTRMKNLNLELEKKNKELEENLKEMDSIRNQLRNILESVNIGIIVINLKGEITVFNNAAQKITGLNGKDVINKRYEENYRGTKDKKSSLLTTLKENKVFVNEEKEIYTKEGLIIPVEYSTSLVINEKGEVLGAVEVFSDMTEIKNLEDEVQRARTLSALGEMAANVAHEIRNPLGGIGGFAALLERELDVDDPRRNLVRKIIEGVSGLNRIAANLLYYTRPMQPKMLKQDIVYVIDEVLALMEVELEQDGKNIAIERNFPADCQEIKLDSEMFHQVLLNLFKNAVESMDDNGKMKVGVRMESDSRNLVVSVEDNGVGMSESVQKKLFNPFFTTKAKGTGLGLAIMKKIIDMHKGRITVISEEGKGSLFEIRMPV
ncbi:PAS domain S-box protein [bacterium]|nr:PAS domain S-box protein [bacterium]